MHTKDTNKLSSVYTRYSDNGMILVSACRSENTEEKNEADTEELREWLSKNHIGFIETLGGWVSENGTPVEEKSFLIPYDKNQFAEDEFVALGLNLCKDYTQDSVLIACPWYNNGHASYVKGTGDIDFTVGTLHGRDPQDKFYTKIKKQANKPSNAFVYKDAKPDDKKYFYGVKGIEFVWHGNWSDPEVIYNGNSYNYWDIEDGLWEDYNATKGIHSQEDFEKNYVPEHAINYMNNLQANEKPEDAVDELINSDFIPEELDFDGEKVSYKDEVSEENIREDVEEFISSTNYKGNSIEEFIDQYRDDFKDFLSARYKYDYEDNQVEDAVEARPTKKHNGISAFRARTICDALTTNINDASFEYAIDYISVIVKALKEMLPDNDNNVVYPVEFKRDQSGDGCTISVLVMSDSKKHNVKPVNDKLASEYGITVKNDRGGVWRLEDGDYTYDVKYHIDDVTDFSPELVGYRTIDFARYAAGFYAPKNRHRAAEPDIDEFAEESDEEFEKRIPKQLDSKKVEDAPEAGIKFVENEFGGKNIATNYKFNINSIFNAIDVGNSTELDKQLRYLYFDIDSDLSNRTNEKYVNKYVANYYNDFVHILNNYKIAYYLLEEHKDLLGQHGDSYLQKIYDGIYTLEQAWILDD